MEKQGSVAVWIGKVASAQTLSDALRVSFSEDGDFLGSAFSRAAAVGYYEDATREAGVVSEHSKDIRQLLKGVSYEGELLPKLLAASIEIGLDDNCFVLLYDVSFGSTESTSRNVQLAGLELRFAGDFRYV
jgi:hypothetical protein